MAILLEQAALLIFVYRFSTVSMAGLREAWEDLSWLCNISKQLEYGRTLIQAQLNLHYIGIMYSSYNLKLENTSVIEVRRSSFSF